LDRRRTDDLSGPIHDANLATTLPANLIARFGERGALGVSTIGTSEMSILQDIPSSRRILLHVSSWSH
jgi:hypothetical protein